MTNPLLASVERLAVRLGTTLHEGTADYARADEALWTASTRARSITERAWDDGPVPDAVIDVVLAAAQRVFRNPDRFVMNQAGTFQGALPQSDFADGDLFLRAELAVLRRHRHGAHALRTIATTREDQTN